MPSSNESPLRSVFGTLEKKYPQYAHHLSTAQTAVHHVTAALDKAAPYLGKVSGYAAAAKEQAMRHRVDEFAPMLLGLALCFFGGSYALLIAVAETVRLLCWADLKDSFQVLARNYKVAVEQNRRDNYIDADGNGVADVQELGQADLFSHKAALFFKSVDVEAVQSAARTIGAAALSVIAALRVKVARSLALGGSLASMLLEYVPLEATLRDALPPENKKWAGLAASTLINVLIMSLATVLSGVIGSVHCCVRGSDMFVQHAVRLAKERGLLEDDMTLESPKAKALVAVVASMGLLWQMSHAEANPFPINILLLPFTITEYVLSFLIQGFLFAAP